MQRSVSESEKRRGDAERNVNVARNDGWRRKSDEDRAKDPPLGYTRFPSRNWFLFECVCMWGVFMIVF